MLQTLFYIPERVFGLPVFGAGILLAVWLVVSIVVLAIQIRRRGWNSDTLSYAILLGVIGGVIYFVLPNLCVTITHHGLPLPGEPRGLPIRGYGTMLLLAVLAAVGLAMYRARRWGIDPDLVFELALWAIIPGIIGARAFHVIEYWPQEYGPVLYERGLAAALTAVINVPRGGLVVYGSLIGGVLGIGYFLYRRRLPLWPLLDLITPSLVLGLAIGRLGCFLNGCCFGGACELPWAVQFPPESPAYVDQLEHGRLFIQGIKLQADEQQDGLPLVTEVASDTHAARSGMEPGEHLVEINGHRLVADSPEDPAPIIVALRVLGYFGQPPETVAVTTLEGHRYAWRGGNVLPARSLPIHPTQLYSSLGACLIFFLLLAYEPFRKRDGELWTVLMTVYPINRFLLEILRTDEPGLLAGLSISQIVSLFVLLAAVGVWIYLLRKPAGVTYPRYQARDGMPPTGSATRAAQSAP